MLTISPVQNIAYYADLARDDYYLDHGEPKGVWYGIGSKVLGLENSTVEDADYEQLMKGFAPTGEPLVQNAGSQKRRAAWDCTFSVPKSVSLIWASASPKLKNQIETAQRESVQLAISVMERKAAITRRGEGSKEYENVSGLVIAAFEHCSNREQEPQLHTHALVLNAAPRFDDSWGTIESRKIYQWKKAIGAMYRVELAYQMRQLGFEVEADGDSFAIKGVSSGLCETYSTRTKQIKEELEKAGVKSSSSREGAALKLTTRKAKKSTPTQTLFKQWKTSLAEQGLSEESVEQLRQNEKVVTPVSMDHDVTLYEITRQKACFTEQDIFFKVGVEASHTGMGAQSAITFAQQALFHIEVVPLQRDSMYTPLYTTQEVLLTENLMINEARLLAQKNSFPLSENLITQAVQSAEQNLGFPFDDEQKEAIFNTLNGGDFCITQGSAGAGKTTLMLAAKMAYQQKGLVVRGACIAKKAADNLTQETAIPSQTIASLVTAIENNKHPLSRVDILVLDEAGLIPSTDLQLLLHEAKVSSTKLILTGEDKQLDAINRGGALRYLSQPDIIGTQRIENIRRQRQTWAKQVVADLRDGRSESAISILEQKGCLHWEENSDTAKDALIKDWYVFQNKNPDKKTLVLAHDWNNVKELSETIRSIHVKDGRVGTENILIKCSVANKSFEYEFSTGDRVKFCKNDHRDLRVSNGTIGTIKHIQSLNRDARITVELDDKRVVSFLASQYSDNLGMHLCHAYALTIYSSQGTTIDGNTFILYTGGMDRANIYVAMSRHKDESHLYINKLEIDERTMPIHDISTSSQSLRQTALADLIKQDRYATLAIEHLESVKRNEHELHQIEALVS